MSDPILLDIQDVVAVITLNRPERLNSFQADCSGRPVIPMTIAKGWLRLWKSTRRSARGNDEGIAD